MKTDNELIAEFMGLPRRKQTMCFFVKASGKPSLTSTWHADLLRYSYSWDWLIPVIERISLVYKTTPHDVDEFWAVISLPLNTPIEEVYKAVVKFIQWYNETKTI